MPKLEPGEKAPAFALKDQDDNTVRLSQFKGSKVLLYFYPKADTPGCTKQSCAVRDARKPLQKKGVVVLGISPDTAEAQKKLDGKYKLGFPLLADTEHRVAAAYGVWGEKSLYGKKFMGITRSAFVIDEKGKISRVRYGVKPDKTVDEALAALEP
jgi:peroxiredoxin Q/BCP